MSAVRVQASVGEHLEALVLSRRRCRKTSHRQESWRIQKASPGREEEGWKKKLLILLWDFFFKIGSKLLSIIFDCWTGVWVLLLLVVCFVVVVLIRYDSVWALNKRQLKSAMKVTTTTLGPWHPLGQLAVFSDGLQAHLFTPSWYMLGLALCGRSHFSFIPMRMSLVSISLSLVSIIQATASVS